MHAEAQTLFVYLYMYVCACPSKHTCMSLAVRLHLFLCVYVFCLCRCTYACIWRSEDTLKNYSSDFVHLFTFFFFQSMEKVWGGNGEAKQHLWEVACCKRGHEHMSLLTQTPRGIWSRLFQNLSKLVSWSKLLHPERLRLAPAAGCFYAAP